MENEKYTCPRCNKEMYWTGDISQDINKNYCSILFVYRCRNCDCNYTSRYERLDSSGERLKYMIDNGLIS